MAKALPRPFSCRDRWRAQVTFNGKRPCADFDIYAHAVTWIFVTLRSASRESKLGGPVRPVLAQALKDYATRMHSEVSPAATAGTTAIENMVTASTVVSTGVHHG